MKREVINSYVSPWDGDKVTIAKCNSSTVVEIEVNEDPKFKKKDIEETVKTKPQRLKKEERIEMIKQMIKQKKSREEIKKALYEKDIYKGNPNPASAFAGDWKAAN